MPVPPGHGLIKVVDVDVEIRRYTEPTTGFQYDVTVMKLKLENGRRFLMSNIPLEIVEAISVMKNAINIPRRQSLFLFLMSNEEFRETIIRNIKEVVIDEIDRRTGLYTASLVLEGDGFNLTIKMIPSHAVFIALLAGKPIYVSEELVNEAGFEEEEEFE